MTYYSASFRQPHVRPVDSPPAIGVMADPAIPNSIIGMAFPASHIGGMRWQSPTADYISPEVVWRLEIDRNWVDGKIVQRADKDRLDGRFVLRSGQFIELAETAE